MSIESLIRDIVREEVRTALGGEVAAYSTATRAEWPPGCRTRRTARDRIRAVPGHEREGDSRASIWRVRVAAYREHYAKALPVHPTGVNEEEIAAAALDAAGLRVTRT